MFKKVHTFYRICHFQIQRNLSKVRKKSTRTENVDKIPQTKIYAYTMIKKLSFMQSSQKFCDPIRQKMS